VAQVSSMKMSWAGFIRAWRARQAARAAATSDRSCSAARSDFYGMARPSRSAA
jgi:hypothetical protein